MGYPHRKLHLSWNLVSDPKHRGSFLDKMACTKEINYLKVICMLFWRKQRPIYFKLQRNRTENGSSNIKDPSIERFQLQMAVLHQSMCISKAGHSILRYIRAEYKDKKHDVSDSH